MNWNKLRAKIKEEDKNRKLNPPNPEN